jgi:hypothetical protein
MLFWSVAAGTSRRRQERSLKAIALPAEAAEQRPPTGSLELPADPRDMCIDDLAEDRVWLAVPDHSCEPNPIDDLALMSHQLAQEVELAR